MGFIRFKKVKKYEYCYLVENTWKKRKKEPRQKVKEYLGRLIRPERIHNVSFVSMIKRGVIGYLKEKDYEDIVQDLVKLAFINYGIKEMGKSEDKLVSGCSVSKEGIVLMNGRKIVIAMNEGYLCTYTLSKLLKFDGRKAKPVKSEISENLESEKEEMDESLEERRIGYNLAKAIVDAGLSIPKEIFIGLFDKVHLGSE